MEITTGVKSQCIQGRQIWISLFIVLDLCLEQEIGENRYAADNGRRAINQ
jgi:hypothetical protein